MARKRVIFSLLYSHGSFMLSRNFRLQRAGSVTWLLRNYNFGSVATCIDELLILDVGRGETDSDAFLSDVRQVIDACFIPVALGGRIDSFDAAKRLIASGADKIVVNSVFDTDPDVVARIADSFGSQAVIGGIDVRRGAEGGYQVFTEQGGTPLTVAPAVRVDAMLAAGAGEILVQSIDNDGTGQGFDHATVAALGVSLNAPVIICGGCGKSDHMRSALLRPDIDAVATANLFNFIGDGLQTARGELLRDGLDLARWDSADIEQLRDVLGR
ncbi:MAG: HisA/HisF-related TIM barrel protein [Pseudomonadota bacterium]